MAINREQGGLDVAQCASAGVDDLVPVKRSFVDAARPVRPCWRAVGGPATVVACPGAVVVVVVGPQWWQYRPGRRRLRRPSMTSVQTMLMLSPLLTLPIVQRRLS